MIQFLLAHRVFADSNVAFAWHVVYIFTSFAAFSAIGAYLRGSAKQLPILRKVLLGGWIAWTLAALLILAYATHVDLWMSHVDFVWLSLATSFGFFARHNRYFRGEPGHDFSDYQRRLEKRLEGLFGE